MSKDRTEKNKNKKEEILEKATQFFYENGYEQTTMRKLAKAVGIDASSIYYYFENKEAIINSIESLAWEQACKLFETVHNIDTTEKRIKEYIRILIQYQIKSKDIALMFDEIVPSKYLKNLAYHRKELYHFLRKELAAFLKTKGLEDSINLTIAVFFIFGAIGQIHRWYDPKGTINPQELADQIIDIFFHGISGEKLPDRKTKNP